MRKIEPLPMQPCPSEFTQHTVRILDELVYAHNERVDEEQAWANAGVHPSPPAPNRIATPQFAEPKFSEREPAIPSPILPSGRELWLMQVHNCNSYAAWAALRQLATIEAVCRWIEYPPRIMPAGTMVSVLRADAQARVDEARKEDEE